MTLQGHRPETIRAKHERMSCLVGVWPVGAELAFALVVVIIMSSVDVLVLGATGFTGRLITKYLAAHPERSTFRVGITVRTKAKGDALLAALSLATDAVTVIELDVTDTRLLEATISRAKVVLNTVGPFWKHGTPVITSVPLLSKLRSLTRALPS